MADTALDADALRRDRQRYADLLDQAEQQIAAWNERADHLQQAVDGFDHLLALAGDDPTRDGGAPRRQLGGRGAASPAPPAGSAAPGPIPGQAPGAEWPRSAADPGPERPRGAGDGWAERPPGSGAGAERGTAPGEPSPVRVTARAAVPAPVTPAAPEPVVPPEAEVPRGTDALRLVFESDVDRTWTLAELIAALDSRGWLPTSRRPEEGVRISLKRLAERGGAMRTDDGRWRLAGTGGPDPSGAEVPGGPRAAEPPSATAPAAQAAPASAPSGPEPSAPDAGPLPAPVRPAAGGTITGA